MIEDWIDNIKDRTDKIKAQTLKDWTNLLMEFWIITAFVAAVFIATVFGFISFVIACLGVVTTAVMLKIIARIEKLEGEKKGKLPKPNF